MAVVVVLLLVVVMLSLRRPGACCVFVHVFLVFVYCLFFLLLLVVAVANAAPASRMRLDVPNSLPANDVSERLHQALPPQEIEQIPMEKHPEKICTPFSPKHFSI